MRKFMLIGLLVLTGCVTSQYSNEKTMCENAPTWVEYAQCLNRIGSAYYAGDSLEQEMIAYRNLLIEKVKTKKLTPTEAEYLRQQKWAQATNRPQVSIGSGRNMNTPQGFQAAPAYQGKIKTECRSSRGVEGGFDCTTQPDAHDALLQHLTNPQR